MTETSADDETARSRTILRRTVELEDAVAQLQNRESAAEADQGLVEARDSFSNCLMSLRSLTEVADALKQIGQGVDLPESKRIASALSSLADRVDADPNAVRSRRRQLDAISTFLRDARRIVDARLRTITADARGGLEAGTVSTLRRIGLNESADALAIELRVLGQFATELPRTLDDLRAVETAAASIQETLATLKEPRNARLLAFVQKVSSANRPTLGDIDATLLAELQESGSAADFEIVARR
jgi:hypothetical protein